MAALAYTFGGRQANVQGENGPDRFPRKRHACLNSILPARLVDPEDERGPRITVERCSSIGAIGSQCYLRYWLCRRGKAHLEGTHHAFEASHTKDAGLCRPFQLFGFRSCVLCRKSVFDPQGYNLI